MLVSALAFAQSRTVTGRVTDAQGKPVPFASVTVKGTPNGVAADENGNFTIQAPPNAVLVFSAAGLQSSEVNIGAQTTVNSSLVNQSALTEVVVTALGQTRSKAKVGYSTTTFNSEQINRAAPANALDALSGKIAGANISKTGGPGSSTKVVLRGYGFLGGGNQPLYVIDGVPLSDARFGASENVDFGNGLNDINPNDIENITVLKGTAASSLYGSNAKNGAIMITTKRGRSGKLKIEYNGSVNFSTIGKLPEMQSTFGQGWGGIFVLPENGSWGPRLDGVVRQWGSIVDNSQLIKPFSFIEDNIRDFYDIGQEFNNTLSLSGGGEVTQFYFSYGNVTSDGVIPSNTDKYQRNTFALRTNSRFKNFTLNSSFNYSNKKQNSPFTGQGGSDGASVFEEVLQIPVDIPITDFKDYKNKFFNVDNYFTPYAENPYYPLYENRNTQNSDRFFGNIDKNYAFTKAFSAQLRMGGDVTNARTFAYKAVNAPSIGSWNKGGNTEGASRAPDVGSVTEGANYLGTINGDFILKYNSSLSPDISLEAFAGVNYFQEDQKGSAAQITNLFIPGFYNLSNSLDPPTASDFAQHRKRIGVYAQTIFGYKNQLYLTLNARNDWSSTLPIDNNSLFYPGASLAWVASQTLDLHGPVSLLKLRASYGKTGSDPNPYLVYPTLALGNVGLGFGNLTFPFNGVTSFGINNTIGNLSLEPIITTEAEIGTEIRFFKNRLGLDLAVYDKKTKGQILTVPIAPSSGYTGLVNNLGSVDNRGIEVALDAKPVDAKDFNWSFTYTFSKNWNKLESLTTGLDNVVLNTAYDASLIGYPGKSLTGIYAPVPKYTADGKIVVSATTGMPVEAEEQGFYGNSEYDYMMGLFNSFNYKKINLSFSLDYRKGGNMYSGTADLLNFTGNAYNTTYNDRKPFIVPNSVVQTGTDASGKPIYEENSIIIDETAYTDYWYPTQNKAGSYYSRIIEKSFLKLRDASLSYTLPQAWASKIHSTNLSIGVYARNILLWTPKSNFYIDPEASNLGNDIGSELGEFRTAPISQQYGVSLRANF